MLRLWIALLALLGCAAALTTVVPAADAKCFLEDVERGEKVYGSFNVFAGGALDIDIKITNANGKVVYEEEKMTQDSFTFIALESGTHSFCFDNTISQVTSKMVSFNIHVGNSLATHDVAKEEHLSPVENSVVTFSSNVHLVKDFLQYYKTRERASRNTNESTNSRVLWWSILETVILVGISIWKIYSLRSFFDKKRTR